MSREKNPLEWLRHAENDRRAAQVLLADGFYEQSVFYCQQAVEKSLKATIVKQTNERPPHTHNLRALLERIPGLTLPNEIAQSVSTVSEYYVGSRYPMDVADANTFGPELAKTASQTMTEIFQWFLTNFSFDNA